MLTRTATQVITDSLKLLGAIAGDEVPVAPELSDAFLRLNELIDSWGVQPDTMVLPHQRSTVLLVADQQDYTVGVGGDLSIARPMAISAAAVLTASSPTTEIPVAVLTEQEYLAIPDKTLDGSPPQAVRWVPSVALGGLWVWPVPTTPDTLVIYADEPIAQFPDLTTPVVLSAGYAKALRTNLAVELAPEFGKQLDPLIDRQARESLADIKRANVELSELSLSGVPGVCGGGYDIETDT